MRRQKKLVAIARCGYDGTYARPSILDVGCGDGLIVPFLYAVGSPLDRYTGIDFAERQVAAAKAQHDVEEYRDATFEIRSFEEEVEEREKDKGTYDIIFFNAVLEFFLEPEKALQNATKLLTREPHARIVISHPLGRAQVRRLNEDFPYQAVSLLPSMDQLIGMVEPLGLEVLAPSFMGKEVEDVELAAEQFYLLTLRWNQEFLDE